MSENNNTNILGEAITGVIASDLLPTTPAPEVASRIKEKLLNKVKAVKSDHSFIFADDRDWNTVADGVQVKVLKQEENMRSILLKMAANTSLPAHYHAADEEACVLEGEVWLEGVLCRTGDYHFASAGSNHQDIHTDQGCLLFIRSA